MNEQRQNRLVFFHFCLFYFRVHITQKKNNLICKAVINSLFIILNSTAFTDEIFSQIDILLYGLLNKIFRL